MRLTIIGASGHGKVVANIAKLCGYDEIVFLDDDESVSSCDGYPVIGKAEKCLDIENDLFVAVGNADVRKHWMEQIKTVTLIHPDAVIADGVKIGEGSVIMPGVVVNTGAKIGKGCILNTCSSVDHDCILADYVHLSVGAHLSGTVMVGEKTWVGVGAVVSNNLSICPDVVIGAGAVVVKDIKEKGTYIGVPAKKR